MIDLSKLVPKPTSVAEWLARWGYEPPPEPPPEEEPTP